MNPSDSTPHRVYLVDLEPELLDVLSVIADYMEHEGMFTPRDLLMMALNLMVVSHCVGEAVEAMEIDLAAVCKIPETPYNQQRLKETLTRYLNAMHTQFHHLNFYGEDAHLQYTFGGMHDDYTPIFVPFTHVQHYKGAISHVVVSEPYGRHPNRIFYPLSNEPDEFEARSDERDYKIERSLKS